MLTISNDGTIELTRGDTARLTVSITNDTAGELYEIAPEDTLILSVKKNITDDEPCLQKTVTGGNAIHIEPEDTAKLAFGKYTYDVQLVTASKDVYTVIVPTTFEILKEVTV